MGTHTIRTSRQAPAGDQWQEALHEALIAALTSDIVAGVGSYAPTNQIIIIMTDAATGDDNAAAVQIVASHDLNTRTADQQEAASYNSDLSNVMARYEAGNLINKTPAQIYTLIQAQVDGWASLADAKAGLRELLPFLAAVAQMHLREKLL